MSNGEGSPFGSLKGIDHKKALTGMVTYAAIPSIVGDAIIKSGILSQIPLVGQVVTQLDPTFTQAGVVMVIAYLFNIGKKWFTNTQGK